MILALDIGNTNIVVGCIKNEDDIVFIERVATNTLKTEFEYAIDFQALLSLYDIKKNEITGCIISSVVPPLNNIMVRAIDKFLGIEPMIVGPGIKTGLNILMDNPASVGADLIVNAVAGIRCYGAPLIMIDMGTATTVSLVDEKANYVGGMILPGVRVSLDSLVTRTSQLPRIGLDAPKKLIGKNTIDCMKSGIIMGQASAMDGLIDRICDEMGRRIPAVATGGLSSSIIPFCKNEVIIDNDLTLKGLKYIYDKNVGSL
ncbi:MAG: type III pantothenate kinase [Lachnospiraceae bacterium]|nr:type III pantothenate kinase [Lachnospiraceae bacterium]